MHKEVFNIYERSEEYRLWPMKEEMFLTFISGKDKNDVGGETKLFGERIGNQLVGFVSAKARGSHGALCFLFVNREYRNRGIGKRLVSQALEYFRRKGVTEVKIGGAPGSYIFPGLPQNVKCEGFFRGLGFEVTDAGLVDMYQDITQWSVPREVYEKSQSHGLKIGFSNHETASKILEFTKSSFPNWYQTYRLVLERGAYGSVFCGGIGDEVVAISHLWMGNCRWDLLFDDNVGGGGVLGVAETHRGKSIGLAMKAWGTERVKERGIKYVWVGSTYAIDFYGKLGFKVWREYYKVRKSQKARMLPRLLRWSKRRFLQAE